MAIKKTRLPQTKSKERKMSFQDVQRMLANPDSSQYSDNKYQKYKDFVVGDKMDVYNPPASLAPFLPINTQPRTPQYPESKLPELAPLEPVPFMPPSMMDTPSRLPPQRYSTPSQQIPYMPQVSQRSQQVPMLPQTQQRGGAGIAQTIQNSMPYDASYTPQSGTISDRAFAGFLGTSMPSNPITQTFGQRSAYDQFSGGVNYGVDYRTPENVPVQLPRGNWKVVEAFTGAAPGTGYLGNGVNRGYGNSILVQNMDTGEKFRFSHLNKVGVKPGQTLQGGEIGLTGSTGNVTGPHLDLEYYDRTGRMADVQKTPYGQMMWQNTGGSRSLPPSNAPQVLPKNLPPQVQFTNNKVETVNKNVNDYYNQIKKIDEAKNKKTTPPPPPPMKVTGPQHKANPLDDFAIALGRGQRSVENFFGNLFKK